MIGDMFNGGALPALERLVQFTEARQQVLADNVANLSTPYFRPRDLDVKAFQRSLGDALARKRSGETPDRSAPDFEDTGDVRFRPDGLDIAPGPLDENVMFHDQNNRDLERIMQDVAENTMAHQMGVAMLKNQFDLIRTAIRERV